MRTRCTERPCSAMHSAACGTRTVVPLRLRCLQDGTLHLHRPLLAPSAFKQCRRRRCGRASGGSTESTSCTALFRWEHAALAVVDVQRRAWLPLCCCDEDQLKAPGASYGASPAHPENAAHPESALCTVAELLTLLPSVLHAALTVGTGHVATCPLSRCWMHAAWLSWRQRLEKRSAS